MGGGIISSLARIRVLRGTDPAANTEIQTVTAGKGANSNYGAPLLTVVEYG